MNQRTLVNSDPSFRAQLTVGTAYTHEYVVDCFLYKFVIAVADNRNTLIRSFRFGLTTMTKFLPFYHTTTMQV